MGRSGTSFLAHFLSRSGVFFNLDSSKSRKLEHPMAYEINKAICISLFGARKGLPFGKLPEYEIQVGDPWPRKVVSFVEHMDWEAAVNGAPPYWAVKDPRLTILHSLWLDEFDVVVAIFRDPYQVVSSFIRREWITGLRKQEVALRYWSRFNKSLLVVHAQNCGKKPLYIVDFNKNMPRQLTHLCEHLRIPLNEDALALYKDSANREEGRHNIASREANEVYDELLRVRNLL
jgi:hypothetical protein